MDLKKGIAIVSLVFLSAAQAKSQESMLNDFSFLYMEKLIAVAKENYPKYKTFDHQINIAKYNLNQEKSSWLDPFSFSYIYRSNSNAINLDNNVNLLLSGYQFGITISPGFFLKKPSAIRAAKEDLKLAQLSKAEYDLMLESEVKNRYLVYLQSFNVLKIRTKSVLDVESSFKLIKARYERNEVSFQDYNNGSIALSSAYEGRITAEGDMSTAKVALETLLTKKLEEIK
ncbi:MAG TPA: TolC family protein [Pedobacter sp.]|uniref:TolC family protein n=1 Tax=Pedobacter sp. TaxID=1411316 RepID=UPI002CADFA0B|nr:TolC family protein [Pedobacter sp.]HMI02531.1 TolC family protein [Pedobacter sp.]